MDFKLYISYMKHASVLGESQAGQYRRGFGGIRPSGVQGSPAGPRHRSRAHARLRALQAIRATVVATLRRRLSLGETLSQVVFIGRVSTGPALLLMIPVGVFIAVSVGGWPAGSGRAATPVPSSRSSSWARPRHWSAR